MITKDDIDEFCKVQNLDEFVSALNKYMPLYGIDTKERIAMFLSQVIHESGGFSRLVENLNYSSAGLMRVWPKRFPNLQIASKYSRKPQAIANKVYADRMGNGPEASGDGWKWRGRSLIQITGKFNYILLDKDVPELKVLQNPDSLLTPEGAVIAACWFWKKNNLNRFADKLDIVGCSKAINGGLIGIEERKHLFTEIKKKIG